MNLNGCVDGQASMKRNTNEETQNNCKELVDRLNEHFLAMAAKKLSMIHSNHPKTLVQKPQGAYHQWHVVRLAKITENAILRLMAACIVSFVDLDGIRHSVEVEAEGLYEASVLGLCAFRRHELEPGGLTPLEVEVRSSVKHTLTVTKVREWLNRGVRSPKEAILKERLRALL
jgi:hypothetical protein